MSEREHGRHNCDCSECRNEPRPLAEHLAIASRNNGDACIALQAEVARLTSVVAERDAQIERLQKWIEDRVPRIEELRWCEKHDKPIPNVETEKGVSICPYCMGLEVAAGEIVRAATSRLADIDPDGHAAYDRDCIAEQSATIDSLRAEIARLKAADVDPEDKPWFDRMLEEVERDVWLGLDHSLNCAPVRVRLAKEAFDRLVRTTKRFAHLARRNREERDAVLKRAARWKALAKMLHADEIHTRVDEGWRKYRVAVSRSAKTAVELARCRSVVEAARAVHGVWNDPNHPDVKAAERVIGLGHAWSDAVFLAVADRLAPVLAKLDEVSP